jgi:hypothetical protein
LLLLLLLLELDEYCKFNGTEGCLPYKKRAMDEDNFPTHSFLGSKKYLLSCLRNRYDNEKIFVKRSQFFATNAASNSLLCGSSSIITARIIALNFN